MTQFSDEQLSAYLDGALDESQKRTLERALEQDESLQRRLDTIRNLDGLLKDAYELSDEIPVHLVETIMDTPITSERPSTVRVNPENETGQRWSDWLSNLMSPAAAATAFALVIGIYLGQSSLIGGQDQQLTALLRTDAAAIDPENPVYEALESTPSNQPFTLDGTPMDVFVKPILSFVSVDDRYCREFEMSVGVAVSVGVACRELDAHWTLEILLAADERSPDIHVYQPAAGYDEQALGTVLNRLMNGPALSAEEEAQLLKNAWDA